MFKIIKLQILIFSYFDRTIIVYSNIYKIFPIIQQYLYKTMYITSSIISDICIHTFN